MNNVQAREAIVAWQGAIHALGQQQPGDRHAELLARYQVRTEQTRWWPHGPAGWLADLVGLQKEVTNTEATMLETLLGARGALGVKEFNDLAQDAQHVSEGRFEGKGGTDGHADAFRHAYWNARMTQGYGEPWAAEFATAHERNPSNHSVSVAMDLHNNQVGREIALANPNASPEQLAGLVEQAVRDGRMVVVDRNGTLVPANEVMPGETRPTSRENPWPPDHQNRADDRDPGPPSARPTPR